MKNFLQYLLLILTCWATTLSSHARSASDNPIMGDWNLSSLQYSDKDIEIRVHDNNGTFTFETIGASFKGQYAIMRCNNCPAPYTDRPIVGLNTLWDVKETSEKGLYTGKGLDPYSGTLYNASIQLKMNGNTMIVKATSTSGHKRKIYVYTRK